MSNIAFEAMKFARDAHSEQVRKYTGQPYADHLAEVAGIVASIHYADRGVMLMSIATAWLHDCVEDQGIDPAMLVDRFGVGVARGVVWLSDMETGNRAERKAASRARLADAPAWVQTIKVADLISNTSSIVKHDPKFALVYLKEKYMLLDVLTAADPGLMLMARQQLHDSWRGLDAPVACMLPPEGWACTRNAGHDGPCAAIPAAS